MGAVKEKASQAAAAISEAASHTVEVIGEVLKNLNLDDPETWEKARNFVYNAIDTAYEKRILTNRIVDQKIVKVMGGIVIDALKYGYQYSIGEITTKDFALRIAGLLLIEAVPAGIEYLVRLLPISIPNAAPFAKDVAEYLISSAYAYKTGEPQRMTPAEAKALAEKVAAEKAAAEEASSDETAAVETAADETAAEKNETVENAADKTEAEEKEAAEKKVEKPEEEKEGTEEGETLIIVPAA